MLDKLRDWAHRRRSHPALASGRHGEDCAHRYLESQGLIVVARNWRPRRGSVEIDLVARDADTLVFVEVKTRAVADYGAPDRAIDWDKRRRIAYAAREYARRAAWDWNRVRFDLIGIVLDGSQPLSHDRDAFSVSVRL
ncbi:MAG: YraN family protein [Acidimicrobiia bacterium]|nr:YraN family protein [Acidimicrobiia bacterium]